MRAGGDMLPVVRYPYSIFFRLRGDEVEIERELAKLARKLTRKPSKPPRKPAAP